MNFIIKILQPKTLSSVSYKLLHLFKGAKISSIEKRYLKLRRVVIGSSFNVIAGCCFSTRSSEEDVLLPSEDTCLTTDTKTLAKVSSLDYETKMKRNATEAISDAPESNLHSPTVNVEVGQNRDAQTKQRLKKIKVEDSSSSNYEPLLTQIGTNVAKHANETADSDIASHQSLETNVTCLSDINDEDNSVHLTKKQLKRLKDKDIKSKKKLKKSNNINASHGKSETEKPRKERPNYFIAIQIFNEQIVQGLKEVQDHILEQEHRLKKSMSKLETLHITLMVMSIKDQDTLHRAKEVLEKIHGEYDDDLSKNPVQLKFRGLKHFNNRVLYAELLQDDSFDRLISIKQGVQNHYEAASIFSTDTKEGFTPHLTVAKIDFKDKKKGVKKINPLLYEEFADQYFGSQRIESIQLLSMTDPKTETGYYSGHELVFSAYNSSSRIKKGSLENLLGIDDKKKEIKEKIKELLKDKCK